MTPPLSTLVKHFAKELIKTVPEFKEFQEAKKALETDPAAHKLWLTKEELRQTIDLLQIQELPVSADQEELFSQKMIEVRGNQIIMRYLKAKNSARKMSSQIGTELYDLVGADFAPGKGCK